MLSDTSKAEGTVPVPVLPSTTGGTGTPDLGTTLLHMVLGTTPTGRVANNRLLETTLQTMVDRAMIQQTASTNRVS